MDAGSDAYVRIQSDPFDGTVMPITYIPDWSKTENQDKTKRFEDIAIADYIPTPLYDVAALSDINSLTKKSLILHYTYITPYMWSYRLNYKEYDGSHVGVDIRAPLGTPALSIANGVVVRTVEADATGNKFVVIRHDNVPVWGELTTIYSAYLHLSQITATEGTKVRKWDMIGRVGMSGIATTPHLHIQIDTKDAPFHPYWPFTSSDSRNAGLWFFESINQGLGKENGMRYNIHPLEFINRYLSWYQGGTNTPTPNPGSTGPIISGKWNEEEEQRSREILLGSYTAEGIEPCSKKRFADVAASSSLGKMLYPLVDTHCMYQKDGSFSPKTTVTKREAIMTILDYYGIAAAGGTSPFLDIAIGDIFQGYAISAARFSMLDGNYAEWEKLLTREEFINLLHKAGKLNKNPSGIKIYADVDAMNMSFSAIQDYAYTIGVRGGKFYPKTLLTRSMVVQMLSGLEKSKK